MSSPDSELTCRICHITKPVCDFGFLDPRYRNKKCSACKAIYNREHHNRPGRKAVVRNNMLRRRYGISSAEYDVMLKKQAGGCAICSNPPSQADRGILNVDHCHATGRVRGLLCIKCNTAIGKFHDDVELLTRAIEYLQPSVVPGF